MIKIFKGISVWYCRGYYRVVADQQHCHDPGLE